MDFEKYNTKLPYPNKEEYTRYTYYDRTEKKEVELIAKTTSDRYVFIEKIVLPEFETLKTAYYEDSGKLHEQFISDMFAENSIPRDSEMGQKMYSISYNHGHSGGISEVYYYFSDLADLYEITKKEFGGDQGLNKNDI
jgi:predicted lipase